MADTVVRVSFERDDGKSPRHPHVEGIMQEQIRQRGADDPTLRSSCRTRHDATVLHLYWSLQPAFDVEKHPRAVRVCTNRLEEQTPIDAVEVALDVDTGLCRCGRCGRKLRVSYSGSGFLQRYVCRDDNEGSTDKKCTSFGGPRVDRSVAQEVIDRLQPLGIEAALAAMNDHGKEQLDKRRQLENALDQGRFEAGRAHRQYDEVDPSNRLVAAELERRWNERLVNVRALEEQLAKCGELPAITLSAEERERLLELGRDLSQAWYGVGASVETRKKIIRLLIEEIIVEVIDDKVELIIHWQGGDHTRLSVKKNKRGQNRWTTDAQVVEFVQVLARHMPDSSIASVLNRSGKSTGRGNSWTSSRVYRLRYDHAIEPYRKGERAERGEVNIEEAASALSVSPSTILRMLNEGSLPGKQLCKGAPWIIRKEDIEHGDVRKKAEYRRGRGRRPSSQHLEQETLGF